MGKIIMGIDPGTRITGYGIISSDGREYTPLDFGSIRPPPHLPLFKRYLILFEGLEKLIQQHRPQAIAVETQFIKNNIQSAMKLGMARGMVMLAAAKYDIHFYEYPPRKAKKAVVGNGAASKRQVQKMMQILLNLPHLPEPEDAADALALALCHAQERKVCTNTL